MENTQNKLFYETLGSFLLKFLLGPGSISKYALMNSQISSQISITIKSDRSLHSKILSGVWSTEKKMY